MWFIFNIGHEADRMVFPARVETNQGALLFSQLTAWKEFPGHIIGKEQPSNDSLRRQRQKSRKAKAARNDNNSTNCTKSRWEEMEVYCYKVLILYVQQYIIT